MDREISRGIIKSQQDGFCRQRRFFLRGCHDILHRTNMIPFCDALNLSCKL